MIYTVTLNPALDKTVLIDNFSVNDVNRIRSIRTDPGGKGINVSKVIQSLGGESTAIGILAGNTGRFIADKLHSMGICCSFSFVPGETRTNMKIIDYELHTNTDINEPGPFVEESQLDSMLAELLEKLKPDDIVILSGSIPSNLNKNIYGKWTVACQNSGAMVFLDADGDLLKKGIDAIPYLIKPNLKELTCFTGYPLTTIDAITEAGTNLQKLGISWVVISLGSDGAIIVHDSNIYRAHGISVPVKSTVGAGDSMMAALALGIAQQMDDIKIIRLAIAVSAANVMCSGTQPASLQDCQSLLDKVHIEKIQ